MANDILNTSGLTTGNQNKGDVIIKLPGRGGANNGYKAYTDRRQTSTVSSIAAKYDTRFDDPRYYTGDAAT